MQLFTAKRAKLAKSYGIELINSSFTNP